LNITVIGRGNVGGGLAERWRRAGHDVAEIGRDGGDASAAEVVLLAVPSTEIESALARVDGLGGKTVLDATNHFRGERPPFESLAHQVKSIVGGSVAKAFNLAYARLYDEIDGQRVTPSLLYCGDEDAREATERLIRDAGFDPVNAGGLESARTLEDALALLTAVSNARGGQVFYRFGRPGEL
jgi:8-hydroxy-5-deazaflavin:NADPH oxidoreductase